MEEYFKVLELYELMVKILGNYDRRFFNIKITALMIFCLILVSQKNYVLSESSTSNFSCIRYKITENTTKYFEGYNLYILERKWADTGIVVDRRILITDMNENIVLEKNISSTDEIADIEFYNTTTLIYGDSEAVRLWNIDTDTLSILGFGGHHDIEVNYLNKTFLTLGFYTIEINGSTYIYDLINEYNSTGSLLRSFDTRNYVEPWQTCPYEDLVNASKDITHANSLCFDEDEKMIYLNCRNTNTFYKIDYETGQKVWGLGEYGDFKLFDIYGKEKDILFYHSHSLEKIGKNKFLLFDNDFHNQTNALNKQSRFLEITIDEKKMIANTTWEWISPTDYWTPIWGDCDLLPNDNRFGVLAYSSDTTDETGPKFVEVNHDGEIVWQSNSTQGDNIYYEIYKVERIRFAPFSSEPRLVNDKNELIAEWNVWYNFKSNTNFTGRCYLYLNNELILNNSIVFSKYWQSKTIRYNLGNIEPGNYEISLILSDKNGHFSNESEFYNGPYNFRVPNNLVTILAVSLGVGIPVVISCILIILIHIRRIKLK